ncbi:MAG: tripartite tricarboxylate transporter substrate binding protein [Proteobacteria bacterium]|nr:tripartite tricarboxylate transporter substrate binding protein [Burkholderiales bacterium]
MPMHISDAGTDQRPIDLIVPFPPDGVTDLTARVLADHLQHAWHRPVAVRNVAGAGGTTGTLEILGAAPDGNTMMVSATGQATQNPAIDSALPYRWDAPTFVARVSASALAFVVRGEAEWHSLGALFEQVRSAPESYRIGTSGTGGASILALARLLDSAGIDLARLQRLTFHGGAAILDAVIDGRTDFAGQYLAEMRALLADGRLRALALSGTVRVNAWPQIPTAAEAGFPSFDLLGWTGIVGPPGLPAAIVDTWDSAVRAATTDPALVSRIEAMGAATAYLGPHAFHQALAAEFEIALSTATGLGLRK